MPMLAATCTSWPSSWNGAANVPRILAARAAASAGCASLGCTSANSSPPSRARVSLARTAPAIRLATAPSSWSPTGWPSVSLTSLKRSRSRSKTAAMPTFAAGTGQGLAEPVEQQGAVRQPGERVVQGQPPDARLGRLALGQVLEHRDLGDDLARRGAHRRGVDGGDAACPVAAFERDFPARSHLAARHRTGERPVEREAAVAPIGGRRAPTARP